MPNPKCSPKFSVDNSEANRLAALYRYGILDTPSEAVFDRITSMASEICDVPIALISLLDPDRQWFKSRVGIEATETPRDIAFCIHAITNPEELTEVVDATKDERFKDNPLVVNDPKIRFYAGKPLLTPDGYALGTLCVASDEPKSLTLQQKSALDHLSDMVVQLLEDRINSAVSIIGRAIENELPLGTFLVDPNIKNGVVISCNKGFEKLTGYTSAEIVGKGSLFALGPNPDQSFVDAFERVLTTKKSTTVILEICRKNQSKFWGEVSISPILDDIGNVQYFICFQKNVTERIDAKYKLEESNQSLQNSLNEQTRLSKELALTNAALQIEIVQRKRTQVQTIKLQDDLIHLGRLSTMGELATGLAHEINQPLLAISQCTDTALLIAKEMNQQDKDLHECLDDIQRETQRTGEIIRTLRQFVGRNSANRASVDVNELIGQTVHLMKSDSRALDIEIKTKRADIPHPVADRVQIAQVLVNLLRNSVDALHNAKNLVAKSGSIRVETSQDDQAILVAVTDNGPGLASNVELFKPFESSKADGLGIGLSISKSIIESHQGTLWFDKSYKNGCKMLFTLPIGLPDNATVLSGQN